MVFGFGWVISRGTAAQTRLAFWIFSALMGAAQSPILTVYTGESITKIFQSSVLSYAISLIAVIAFTVLTAYDVQNIRQMYYAEDIGEIASKKAVAGALSLYMDFINIFIALLNLFGDRR